MNKIKYSFLALLTIITCFSSCDSNAKNKSSKEELNNKEWHVYKDLTDNQLMDTIQYYSMQYFWNGAEPKSGMARERILLSNVYPNNDYNVITTGGSGFGIMSILVGIYHGWISNDDAIIRFEKILSFLENADRYHGAWSHWMYGETGKTKPFGEKDDGGDLVESSILAEGLICLQEYYISGTEREKEISARAESLWKSIDFRWYQDGKDYLYWHWSPNYAWEMNMPIRGYNETLITYIIGAASTSYKITKSAWDIGWYQNGSIVESTTKYGITLPIRHENHSAGGPLFWAHYSYCGFNPMITSDKYVNYKIINTAHVMLNRAYCIANPKEYPKYGENLWGLTASYSPANYKQWEQEGGRDTHISYNPSVLYLSYAAHNPDLDYGVISPTAALSSMPYAPQEVLKVARNIYENYGTKAFRKYGPIDAFSIEQDWFPEAYLAIDQGPIVCMIENYRSGLLWNLFMKNKDIQNGLDFLGITVNK